MSNKKRVHTVACQMDSLLLELSMVTIDHKNAEQLRVAYVDLKDMRNMISYLDNIPEDGFTGMDSSIALIESGFALARDAVQKTL